MIDFDSFFNVVLETDAPDSFKSKILENKEFKTNILYLTNQCNLNCEYCYQAKDRNESKPSFINEKEVEKFFDEVIKNEPLGSSVVVLFGGEPFLNEKMFYYILDYTDSITEKTGKKFNLSTTTNGIYFKDEQKCYKFINRIKQLKNHFSLEISYDGSGQDRRIYPNGKSTKEDVKNVIKKLLHLIDFSIRYTIHKDNYKNVLKDLVQLSKLNIKKIIVNFYESELDQFINSNELKTHLIQKTNEIYRALKKPICHLNCQECKGCNHSELFNRTINYGLNDKSFEVKGNALEFNHFTKEKR